jgi:hypothetical protein
MPQTAKIPSAALFWIGETERDASLKQWTLIQQELCTFQSISCALLREYYSIPILH